MILSLLILLLILLFASKPAPCRILNSHKNRQAAKAYGFQYSRPCNKTYMYPAFSLQEQVNDSYLSLFEDRLTLHAVQAWTLESFKLELSNLIISTCPKCFPQTAHSCSKSSVLCYSQGQGCIIIFYLLIKLFLHPQIFEPCIHIFCTASDKHLKQRNWSAD